MKARVIFNKPGYLLKGFMLCFILWPIMNTVSAQQEIKLYPDGPEEVSGMTEKETMFGSSWVVNVTDARMKAYIVPQDQSTGTAILVCPGGGYGGLAIEHEGTNVAEWLNSVGISAFVLYYRMPDHHAFIPLKDAQTAIEYLREHSAEFHIDQHKIGIAGFSAGGHLASVAGTQYTTENRPDFMILVYPVITMMEGDGTCRNLLGDNPPDSLMRLFSTDLQVTEDTPPAFLVAAKDDDVVSIEHTYRFYNALRKNNVEAEMLTFETGGHSFGIKKQGSELDSWPDQLLKWMKKLNLIEVY